MHWMMTMENAYGDDVWKTHQRLFSFVENSAITIETLADGDSEMDIDKDTKFDIWFCHYVMLR